MPELDEIQRELKNSIAPVMTAFEEFKATNDENLKKRDALLEEKLAKINTTLDGYESMSQKLTLAEANQKALEALNAQVDGIEAAIKRLPAGAVNTDAERKTLVNN